MSQTPHNGANGKPEKALWLAGLFTMAFMLYYLFMAVSAPSAKIADINHKFGYKKPEKGGLNNSILKDSAFIMLNRQKAFCLAKLAMAAEDSVALSVNLPDSIATLEISGVTVFSVKISKTRISRVFCRADEYALSAMLSKPFVVNRYISSIRKEPVVHKVAPKDTTEYKPDAPPDTSKVEYVNFILETNDGIRLYVYQETSGNVSASFRRFVFDITDRMRNAAVIVKSMALFRKPAFNPYIKIVVPQKAARIIFRAIPQRGKFAVNR